MTFVSNSAQVFGTSSSPGLASLRRSPSGDQPIRSLSSTPIVRRRSPHRGSHLTRQGSRCRRRGRRRARGWHGLRWHSRVTHQDPVQEALHKIGVAARDRRSPARSPGRPPRRQTASRPPGPSRSRSRTRPTRSRSPADKARTSSTRRSSRAASHASSCCSTATMRDRVGPVRSIRGRPTPRSWLPFSDHPSARLLAAVPRAFSTIVEDAGMTAMTR